ncbi:bifunctional enoyl-CoA hydratase/phosphate acetyltransferase [Desulfocurvus vexinensis]|uniref:bifunctional enoyl-CoA hydratase/phosphate acetyltransferase n=1 Tax=Desulfocurvus vexinensis TaxID=399548 RepID=UPI00048C0D8B|nr:bifunctional enoyl-CoA hydratase/phosphate acetyltransferase [Desulfocurvus vexinensis]
MPVDSLRALVREALPEGPPPRVAIARSANGFVLAAAVAAWQAGLAEPVLIGDMDATARVAAERGLDITPFEQIETPDDETAVRQAVDLFRQGRAALIMKGLVPTATLLRAVLDKEHGAAPKGILSHVTLFEEPHSGRLMLLTDPAVNIRPNLQRKVEIVRNAVGVARRLGIPRPRVAMLAATEKVNFPAMPATLDADLLAKMGEQGEFGDARVAGPMALDVALSPQAASLKRVQGDVAGQADILVAPDIESGNVLYKCLNTLLDLDMAGVVVGSRVPIVVPSRGDSPRTKFLSIALAAFLAREEPA